jgi:hypothetical protein
MPNNCYFLFCFVLRIDQIHTGGQFRSFFFKPQLRPHALALLPFATMTLVVLPSLIPVPFNDLSALNYSCAVSEYAR